MSSLYRSPLRVYLCLGALAFLGIYCALKLPVSLFPNSSKPEISVYIPYGPLTAREFLDTHGRRLESQLRQIHLDQGSTVDSLKAYYETHGVSYQVAFTWDTPPTAAEREVRSVVTAFSARLPEESREYLWIRMREQNTGFFAASFYSNQRSLDDLYDLVQPLLAPLISKVPDAADPEVWNPTKKEIRVELSADVMASLQLLPKDVEAAVVSSLQARTGGSVTIGKNVFSVEMPRESTDWTSLGDVLLPLANGASVPLAAVARIYTAPRSSTRSFKTSGAPSLILWATPKPGGNVKRMSEDLLAIVASVRPQLPPDVEYKVLVDPSEFIRSAIYNVFKEVGIAALLAVLILFLFIGSFKNVITAAIEIPLSMVLAFILMKITGINLNLISLGGLALAAGMNVDASVVVMENIFRHFEAYPGKLDPLTRLKVLTDAVKEVQFPIIASTISSLVVFLPLLLTSSLSHALLGDLALAVIFSHGFSAIVALVLVPTVRLQLMASEEGLTTHHSPLEGLLQKLEKGYSRALSFFISHDLLRKLTYVGVSLSLVALFLVVFPRLPKEVVGLPDTDWVYVNVNTEGNTRFRQMETTAEELEKRLLARFGDKISYTFNQVFGANSAFLMARLKDKGQMKNVWHSMEEEFKNTPTMRFYVGIWNPSELPIPDPPHLRLSVRDTDAHRAADTTTELHGLIESKRLFARASTDPALGNSKAIVVHPQRALLTRSSSASANDLIDLVRTATEGKRIGALTEKNQTIDVFLRYPEQSVRSLEDIASLPLGIHQKIIPLSALASVNVDRVAPPIYRQDETELYLVEARQNQGQERTLATVQAKARNEIEAWIAAGKKAGTLTSTVTFENASKELTESLQQLGIAVGTSILLIFLTLVLQFGSLVEPLLVLVSVPLGILGVLLSLFIFGSTVSLNSVLGVILLNGISVANSIILVDFIKRLVDQGLSPLAAAIEAAQKRLRPILITSLTTILGMLPIALGMGEGGKVLQPLGIAVSGGLWISMLFTLFLVPALHVAHLQHAKAESREEFPYRIPWKMRIKRWFHAPTGDEA